ncbi:phage major capsid protein [Alteromonas sp. W364]|uniref:phage major capsid protein n=1 Tax=Alteromonas sp. W364 TaxID=3075610 RepID=UPI002887AB3A|nr:phage major capsid protein [Alteromonas sp. W364]MDT0626882.1 phage major capsid protein [Alteromonas sp. W364]
MSVINKKLTRFLDKGGDGINEETRTVDLAFSSETPYLREFGMEILDHSAGSVDLSRLKDGAPLLVDHDVTDVVGVVEQVSIGSDRVGRVKVRFGNSARAVEVFNDIKDKIRRHVSVGYQILEGELEQQGADNSTVPNYRVTKWMPFEVSIVSVPADMTVGIGRNLNNDNARLKKMTIQDTQAQSAQDKQRSQITEMIEMGNAYNEIELAHECIRKGGDIGKLTQMILAKRSEGSEMIKSDPFPSHTRGNPAPSKREYSVLNVIRSLSGDNSVDIGYETELNQELQHQRGGKSKGFSIPIEQLGKRSITAAGDGANLIESVYQPNSMIEFLRNKSVIMNSGAQSMQVGTSGDLVLPRQTGTASAEWLDLDGTDTISESNQTFDHVDLKMKTLTAMTTYTHRMLKQGLPGIEQLIIADLSAKFASEIDKTALQGVAGNSKIPTGILNYTGVSSLTSTNSIPTFAEVVEMERLLADDNIDTDGLMYVTNPTIGTTLKTVEKAANTAQFIWTDSGQGEGMVNGYKSCYTNNMPADTMLLGQFRDLIMAYWGSIDITVDPYGDNFKKGNVSVRAMMDLDINLRRPESFCKLTLNQ